MTDNLFFRNFPEADRIEDIERSELLVIPDDLPVKFVLPFVKYHLYLYDKGSSIIRKYRELEKRQDKAFELSGIKGDQFHNSNMEEMRLLEMPGQGALVISILKAQNDAVWRELVLNEQVHLKICVTLLTIKDEDATEEILRQTKLLTESAAVAGRIDQYYKQLFSSVHLHEHEKIKRRILPETVHLFRT